MSHQAISGGTGIKLRCVASLYGPLKLNNSSSSTNFSSSASLSIRTEIHGTGAMKLTTKKLSELGNKIGLSGTSTILLSSIVHNVRGCDRDATQGTASIILDSTSDLSGATG